MPFDSTTPRFSNPVTGRTFTGETNIAALVASGLSDPHWATFQQWKTAGRIVRKGQSGTVLFGRGFRFRVFAESQTDMLEAIPTPPAVLAKIAAPAPDPDTCALSAWYCIDAARKLYWSGKADALDADMAGRVAIAGLSAASRVHLHSGIAAVCSYARDLYALGSVTPIRSAWNDKPEPVRAKRFPKAKFRKATVPESFGEWVAHPVTGYRVRIAKGSDVRDLIPFGHDPAALEAVRREWLKHGRIGAANTLVGLDRDGLKGDAAGYRKRMHARRKEAGEGSPGYSYGPRSIDVTQVREAVTIDDAGRSHAVSL